MSFAIDVVASPADAFALISDISRHAEWSPQEFEANRLDDGLIRVGTRYRTAGRKGARKGVLRSTDVVVTVFDPIEVFAFDATEKAGTYRTTFQISAAPGSGAHVVRTVDPPTSGIAPFIRHRILRPVVRSYLQKNMDALKARLDTMTTP
jgi:hypothetical protein